MCSVFVFFQAQLSRRLRQIGQELFHLRQSNHHTEPLLNGNVQLLARFSEGRSHVSEQSGAPEALYVTKLSPPHNVCVKQDQNAVQQIVCDDEVMFKTAGNRKLPVRYVKY